MFVVDTNSLIYFFKGQGRVGERLLDTPPSEIGVPSIVLYELEVGIAKSSSPKKRQKQLGELVDIIELLPEPKPHSNTVATLLKILVEKGFVQISNPNRNNLYSAKVSKLDYSGQRMAGLTESFFEGSYTNVVSYLLDKKQMSIEDLELLLHNLKSKGNE